MHRDSTTPSTTHNCLVIFLLKWKLAKNYPHQDYSSGRLAYVGTARKLCSLRKQLQNANDNISQLWTSCIFEGKSFPEPTLLERALLFLLLPSRSCHCLHPRDKGDMTNILEARWSQIGWGTANWELVIERKSCTGTDGILRISAYFKLTGNLSSLHWNNDQLKCQWKRENPTFSTGLALMSYDTHI